MTNPSAVKAMIDSSSQKMAEYREQAKSRATSEATDPGRPNPSKSKTDFFAVPGHDLIPTEDLASIVSDHLFKCRCGHLPEDPEDQERHLERVRKANKKPFVPAPHLTHRPLVGNEALATVRNQLEFERRRRRRSMDQHPSNHKPKTDELPTKKIVHTPRSREFKNIAKTAVKKEQN